MLQEKPKADFIPPVSVDDNQASYTDEDKVILMELMS